MQEEDLIDLHFSLGLHKPESELLASCNLCILMMLLE
jgi:hypothetical protein